MKKAVFMVFTVLILTSVVTNVFAVDWPMWRFDEGRSACSTEQLPDQLDAIWSWKFSPREPVWDDPLNRDMMQYDKQFEPIVLGNTLFVGFNDKDKVVAIDTESGQVKWSFYADGPVRMPLAGRNGKLYFTSDDGFLYCLSAISGEVLWKFQGGPLDRKILGNKRLISSWPARGGVVLKDDKVYFAASIWPLMGTFIYSLDAETGKVVWRNEGMGSRYMLQPHNSPAFASIAPQGTFVVSGDYLLIPGGRSVPACFDRHTGEMIYYHLADYNKNGGAFVCANDTYFFNHARDRETNLFDLKTGERLLHNLGKYPVLDDKVFYMSGDSIIVRNALDPEKILSVIQVEANGDLIKAGNFLYAGGKDHITCIDVNDSENQGRIKWTQKIDGTIARLIAANEKLFAVTTKGEILAFGTRSSSFNQYAENKSDDFKIDKSISKILEQTDTQEGYALYYGIDKDKLASFAKQSEFSIIAFEADPNKVDGLRKEFDANGLLSAKLSILPGEPETASVPPYMASLIVVNNVDRIRKMNDLNSLAHLFDAIRPYGGKMWMPDKKGLFEKLTNFAKGYSESELNVEKVKDGIVVCKTGPLKGASNWTHQYGNISNTVKSDDELVKLPLGILWFGGNSNLEVLPRHGHGPPEQIMDGRLIIEGMDCISARDVYTGRVFWKTELDCTNVYDTYYDESYTDTPLVATYNQEHLPGANSRNTNFVVTKDNVYVLENDTCRVLDIETGKDVKKIMLPAQENEQPEWGYIGIVQDLLIAGSDFVPFSAMTPLTKEDEAAMAEMSRKNRRKEKIWGDFDDTASKELVILDRHTAQVKWEQSSRYGFIHNAITASDELLYCLDKLPPGVEKKMQRRGMDAPTDYRLIAYDLESGKPAWTITEGVFGSWLSYSKQYNRLIQATRPSRDMIRGEDGERMSVYNATTGELIWDKPIEYHNPPILHGDRIITDNAAYNLETGEAIFRTDPITDQKIQWTYSRAYGCNYNIASEYLLSFRSAAAGFYDLYRESGTGNFGGFKSGCTSNLIAAGGLLNAPDYTRTCQCSYQNQTSLAFIHMPELEYWTTNDFEWNGSAIQHVGINLNAPGDRIDDNGTLWMDYPSVGGKSPDIPIKIDSLGISDIRRHSLFLDQNGFEWIGASALTGPIDLDITVDNATNIEHIYNINLVFAELEDMEPGERVFDVYIQGIKVLADFDVVKEAGGQDLPITRSFEDIKVTQDVEIRCVSVNGSQADPLLCGVELINASFRQ